MATSGAWPMARLAYILETDVKCLSNSRWIDLLPGSKSLKCNLCYAFAKYFVSTEVYLEASFSGHSLTCSVLGAFKTWQTLHAPLPFTPKSLPLALLLSARRRRKVLKPLFGNELSRPSLVVALADTFPEEDVLGIIIWAPVPIPTVSSSEKTMRS